MSQPPAARVEGLWKSFGYRPALRGVDLVVPAGSCFAIFGPNGAGKSTLLKILAGRLRPASGRVEILGHDLRRRPIEARRRIGAVFHESCLRGDLTLEENLRFYASLYGLSNSHRRSGDLTERLGLSGRSRDPVRGFSEGMRKRAALIRSLLHEPGLWLLDEPFSGLDPAGQDLFEELVAAERCSGRSTVLITHDVARGLRLATDGAFLERGEVAARGRDEIARRLAGNSRED